MSGDVSTGVLRPTLNLLAVVVRRTVRVQVPRRHVKRLTYPLPTHPFHRLGRQPHLRVQFPSLLLRRKNSGHRAGIAPPEAGAPRVRAGCAAPIDPAPPAIWCSGLRSGDTAPAPPFPQPLKNGPTPPETPPSLPGRTLRHPAALHCLLNPPLLLRRKRFTHPLTPAIETDRL